MELKIITDNSATTRTVVQWVILNSHKNDTLHSAHEQGLNGGVIDLPVLIGDRFRLEMGRFKRITGSESQSNGKRE